MKMSDRRLIEWAKTKLSDERISRKEFAQIGKMSGEMVSRILLHRRKVTIEFIVACIHVFHVSPNEVFEVMGLYKDPHHDSGSHKLSNKDREIIAYLTGRLEKK